MLGPAAKTTCLYRRSRRRIFDWRLALRSTPCSWMSPVFKREIDQRSTDGDLTNPSKRNSPSLRKIPSLFPRGRVSPKSFHSNEPTRYYKVDKYTRQTRLLQSLKPRIGSEMGVGRRNDDCGTQTAGQQLSFFHARLSGNSRIEH